MLTPRFLRKRWVLALIFVGSFIYFVSSIYKQSQQVVLQDHEPVPLRPSIPPIHWPEKSDEQDSDADSKDLDGAAKVNATTFKTCRNSVQGKVFITDDKGYVCRREHVVAGGCCDIIHPTSRRYVCESCHRSGCCEIYEHCVSCCLQPEKQSLLRKILGQAQDPFQALFASVTDHFELCLAKCRTSSQSVQHENSYRDPLAKYCYGENPPDIQPLGLQS